MDGLGPTAYLIVAGIVLLVAVPGLLAKRGGAVGRAFSDFGRGSGAKVTATPAVGVRAVFCTECGSGLASGAAFCTQCGTPVAAAPGSKV